MNFIIRDYISILKEDGELDLLLVDLLFCQGYAIQYKPVKGRQYGVDILATKKKNGKLSHFLIVTVKRGDITRKVWDGSSNATKQSLDDIIEVYIPKQLTPKERKVPINIVLATNGHIVQNLSLNWTSYKEKVSNYGYNLDFWGIDDISNSISEEYLYDSVLKETDQTLFRKTLMFLDLPDHNHEHYNELIDSILDVSLSQTRDIQRRLRLLRLLLSIIFQWSNKINNLRPIIDISHISVLKSFSYLEDIECLNKREIVREYYQIQKLSRDIAVAYFNKVANHYSVEHSLNRYAGNHIESNFRCWEELGFISILALFELNNYQIACTLKDKAQQEIYSDSLNEVGKSLNTFIKTYTSLNNPLYDDQLIEINMAMQVLRWCGKGFLGIQWIDNIIISMYNQYKLKKMFPLFRPNYDNLIDIYFGKKQQKIESSMLLASLLDWAVIFDSEITYNKIKEFVEIFESKISIQTWYPSKESSIKYLKKNYSTETGNVYSFKKIPTFDEYRNDLIELREKFIKQDDFAAFNKGLEFLHSISSFHHRQLPMPYLSHRFV